MKIAVLTNDYPPSSTGGAGVIAERLTKGLEALGHEVRVWHSPPTFSRTPIFARFFAHLLDLRPKAKLVHEITEWRPDILLTHNLTGCGFGTPSKVKTHGIPWVHVVHDVQLFEPSGRIMFGEALAVFRRIWRLVWAFLRGRAFGSPNVVVSPTRWLLNIHRSYGFFRFSKTAIIPNPLPVRPSQTRPWTEREPSILFVGRLDADKGIDVLLRAWKNLGADRPRLELAGEGSRSFDLAATQDGRLIVHGRVANDRILSLMERSRVLVVPSLVSENQPTVALEGFAAGCNVIGSDVGGLPETLDGAGTIVPAKDVQALCEAMRHALVTPPDAEAQRRVLELHRPDVVVEALAALLISNA